MITGRHTDAKTAVFIHISLIKRVAQALHKEYFYRVNALTDPQNIVHLLNSTEV